MTKILIADDHQLLREALQKLLEDTGHEVVGSVGSGREALERSREAAPDVILMDIVMPGLNGIEATRRLRSTDPGIKVVGLTGYTDPSLVGEMIAAGAAGVFVKSEGFARLRECLRRVVEGQSYLSAAIDHGALRTLLDEKRRSREGEEGPVPQPRALTGRQREVLQLVAEGRTTREIAGMLDVSAKTVESHRANIMDKLGLRSVAELTKYAVKHGITTPEP